MYPKLFGGSSYSPLKKISSRHTLAVFDCWPRTCSNSVIDNSERAQSELPRGLIKSSCITGETDHSDTSTSFRSGASSRTAVD